jgi:hypothetical protein
MKSYGVFWGVIGVAFGVYAMQETRAPEAFGIDPASLWTQYSPLILGAILAIVNNGDWPAWIKNLVGIWAKEKGADIDAGNKLIDLWKRAVDLMDELKADPNATAEAIESAKDVVTAINQQVMQAGAKK